MQLLTKELEHKLEQHPLHSSDDKGFDADVVVKFFIPCGSATWLITEGEKQSDGDWLLFGYIHILEEEWGYVRLSELENVKLPYGIKIERDIYSKGTVKELAKCFEREI